MEKFGDSSTEKGLPERMPSNKERLADSEHIKQRTDFYTKKAERYLAMVFGQTDLSIVEKSKLREIAESCIRQRLEEMILWERGEMPGDKMINIQMETVYRWLWELYDIKRSDIPGESHGHEVVNIPEDFKEYLRRLRTDSHLV